MCLSKFMSQQNTSPKQELRSTKLKHNIQNAEIRLFTLCFDCMCSNIFILCFENPFSIWSKITSIAIDIIAGKLIPPLYAGLDLLFIWPSNIHFWFCVLITSFEYFIHTITE